MLLLYLNYPQIVYPFVGVLIGSMPSRILCIIPLLCLVLTYNKVSRISETPNCFVLLHPISALILIWTVVNSMFKVLKRGGIEWRGTYYSIKELRKQNL